MSRKKYVVIIIIFYSFLIEVKGQSPNTWSRIADFAGASRGAGIAFSIGGLGYVGLGINPDSIGGYNYLTDLWQYNPNTNTWAQKASFPSAGRNYPVCFVIGSKAYVGLGMSTTYPNERKDFWEYDPATDTWTQKADFAGAGRQISAGFSVGNNGYAGLGYLDTARTLCDLWKYSPDSDSWTQVSPCPGKQESVGFSIGNKGYAGFGLNPNTNTYDPIRDIWEYDPVTDSWMQKADYPGLASIQGTVFNFSIGSFGYIGTGEQDSTDIIISDFWQFDPTINTWIQKDSFGGGVRAGGVGFTIGNKGYAGLGGTYSQNYNDFWMYTPDSISTGIRNIDASNISIYPDPSSDKLSINNLPPSATLTISDMTGRVYTTILSGQHIDVSALPTGVYCLHIQDSGGSVVRKFVKE